MNGFIKIGDMILPKVYPLETLVFHDVAGTSRAYQLQWISPREDQKDFDHRDAIMYLGEIPDNPLDNFHYDYYANQIGHYFYEILHNEKKFVLTLSAPLDDLFRSVI